MVLAAESPPPCPRQFNSWNPVQGWLRDMKAAWSSPQPCGQDMGMLSSRSFLTLRVTFQLQRKQWEKLFSSSVTQRGRSFSLQEEKCHLYCWTGTNFPKISVIWYRCHQWPGILVLAGFQSSFGLRDHVHSL